VSPVLAFGDDRSEGAETCWQWITSHRWEGWSLEVVTAEPPADMRPVEPPESELNPWDPDVPRQAPDAGFSSVTHLRAEIDPRLALIARPWDLVAIGPRGDGWLKSLHLGSTADWLLREPTSPLVITRRPGPVGKVLVADDGSDHARRAYETLAGLPWLAGVRVRLLSVADGRIEADQVVARATGSLSSADVETVVREGGANEMIVAEIEDFGPDLVVMGARGVGGFKSLIVGSSTATVAGATECSLLVAHAGGPQS
jgi:nucleotide-binding universal stress UspA family protein